MTRVDVRTVLVPTDFSDGSLHAMRYAMALAELTSAKVVFLHVVEPPAYGVELAGAYPGFAPEVTKKLAEMMHDWVEQVRVKGIAVEWHLEMGAPFAEILAAVERYGADLVVMGTHGRTGVAHLVVGSVAERVVQHARCPVLTVKAQKEPVPAGQPAAAPPSQAGQETSSHCRICGKASVELICEGCKARVQAEALARKAEIEKAGRSGDSKFARPGEWR